MAGLGGRMSTVVKAKVSKLLDKAEDPAETLDYSYQKQVESLQNVKKGIADVVTAKKRLQMQAKTLQRAVVKLDTQARQALSQGNEELARVGARAQERRADRAAVARHAGRRTRSPAAEADRLRGEAARQDRGLPHEEGGHQGAVLRRRGAGADLRGRHGRRRGDGRRGAGDAARGRQDREHAARAPTPSPSSRRPGRSTTSPSSAPGTTTSTGSSRSFRTRASSTTTSPSSRPSWARARRPTRSAPASRQSTVRPSKPIRPRPPTQRSRRDRQDLRRGTVPPVRRRHRSRQRARQRGRHGRRGRRRGAVRVHVRGAAVTRARRRDGAGRRRPRDVRRDPAPRPRRRSRKPPRPSPATA